MSPLQHLHGAFLLGIVLFVGTEGRLDGPASGWLPAYLLAWILLVPLAWRLQTKPVPKARAPSQGWKGILLWALLLRLPLQVGPPQLSDDINRYHWEGQVVAAGEDPFDRPPNSTALQYLRERSPTWAAVNHPHLPAIYPPGAQWIFAAMASLGLSINGFRGVFVLLELLVLGLLAILLRRRGLPEEGLVLAAWNPLLVLEVSSSGHFEPLALLPLVAGLVLLGRSERAAWATFGLGLSIKFAGAVPAWFEGLRLLRARQTRVGVHRTLWLAAVPVLLALPFCLDGSPPVGSLLHYARHWGHNATVHAFLTPLLGFHPARWVCITLILLWLGLLSSQRLEPARGAQLFFAGVLFLSPVVHPWYGLWVAVLLPLAPSLPLLLFTGLLPLSYLGSWGPGGSELPVWVQPTEALVPLVGLAAVLWSRRIAPQTAPGDPSAPGEGS